jgi:hypothetical protein
MKNIIFIMSIFLMSCGGFIVGDYNNCSAPGTWQCNFSAYSKTNQCKNINDIVLVNIILRTYTCEESRFIIEQNNNPYDIVKVRKDVILRPVYVNEMIGEMTIFEGPLYPYGEYCIETGHINCFLKE